MNRLFKGLAFVSVAILILIDLSTLYDAYQLSTGAQVFSQLMYSKVPCGIFFGVTCLLGLLEKRAVKPLSIITMVIFGLMAMIWLFGLILQFELIAKGTGDTGMKEYLLIAEFAEYILLLITGMLFMLLLYKKILRRTCLVGIGVSAGVLLVTWTVILIQNISANTFLESGFIWSFLSAFCEIAAYVILIAFFTGELAENRKPKGLKANG